MGVEREEERGEKQIREIQERGETQMKSGG